MSTPKIFPETTAVKSHTLRLLEEATSEMRSYYASKQLPPTMFDTLPERILIMLYLLINKSGVIFLTKDIFSELVKFGFDYMGKRNAVETLHTALNEPEKFDEIYEILADQESKEIFDWLIKYRVAYALGSDEIAATVFPLNDQPSMVGKYLAQTLQDFLMKTHKVKGYAIKSLGGAIREIWNSEVYLLKDRCQPLPGDIVIEAGAYCGESAIWFADKVGKSGRVFTFEPSAKFIPIIQKNIHQNGMDSLIEIVPKGVWDEDKDIFLSNASQASQSSETAAAAEAASAKAAEVQKIEGITLDSFVSSRGLERVDFIKMDIEGAEMRALRGAEKTIRKFKPRLAICIYHLPTDIYEMPLLLKSMVPEYNFYLSQKSTSPVGTVLFANVKGK